jgi:uncharacterized membrane protein YozB (DUF420 family)
MISHLPEADAILNSLSAIFLLAGFYFIRRRRIAAHKACMLSAFATSVIFLGCYLTYHFTRGVVRFPGHGLARPFYFVLLGTHTVLAAAIVPLALVTLSRALRKKFDLHRRIARWTLPIWLYVSITGVAVYWILYRIYGAK